MRVVRSAGVSGRVMVIKYFQVGLKAVELSAEIEGVLWIRINGEDVNLRLGLEDVDLIVFPLPVEHGLGEGHTSYTGRQLLKDAVDREERLEKVDAHLLAGVLFPHLDSKWDLFSTAQTAGKRLFFTAIRFMASSFAGLYRIIEVCCFVIHFTELKHGKKTTSSLTSPQIFRLWIRVQRICSFT